MFGGKARELQKKALQAFSQGKFAEAEARLIDLVDVTEARIARNDDEPGDYFNLGLAQVYLGRVQRTRDLQQRGFFPLEGAIMIGASGDLALNLSGLKNLLQCIKLCSDPVLITQAGILAAQVLSLLEKSSVLSGDLDGDLVKKQFPEPRRKGLAVLSFLVVMAQSHSDVRRVTRRDSDLLQRILVECSPGLLLAARQGEEEFNNQAELALLEAGQSEQGFIESLFSR